MYLGLLLVVLAHKFRGFHNNNHNNNNHNNCPCHTPIISCGWAGHCLGSSCVTFNDCSGNLICTNNICSISIPTVIPTVIPTSIPTPTETAIPTPTETTIPTPTETTIPTPTETTIPTPTETAIPTPTETTIPTPTETAIPTPTETAIPTPTETAIPIISGNSATLTIFNDISTQCYNTNIPSGNGVAVNPLLLGFTTLQWDTIYANADPSVIPWCGKTMTITVNSKTFVGTIIDTCDIDGAGGGAPCDYNNVIDLYTGGTSQGAQFINSINGDDFYQGPLTWTIS